MQSIEVYINEYEEVCKYFRGTLPKKSKAINRLIERIIMYKHEGK